MNSQCESLLFRLPGELRNQIYTLSLTSPYKISDPSIQPNHTSNNNKHRVLPVLGTPIIRSCKRIYYEISLSSLYTQNAFRFTSATIAHKFFSALSKQTAALIKEVEIDLRNVSDNYPSVESEWTHYLTYASNPFVTGKCANKIVGLGVDAPNIRVLHLNVEAWYRNDSPQSLELLRNLLQNVCGLDRVVVTGSDGSALLAREKETHLRLCGPVIFTGVMAYSRLDRVLECLAKCVEGQPERKIVRWSEQKRVITLEIMTREHFRNEFGTLRTGVSSTILGGRDEPCSLVKYKERWHLQQSLLWP
jgi:hypothetical protein